MAANVLLNNLYKHTPLHLRPTRGVGRRRPALDLRRQLAHIEHQVDVIMASRFRLAKAERRAPSSRDSKSPRLIDEIIAALSPTGRRPSR